MKVHIHLIQLLSRWGKVIVVSSSIGNKTHFWYCAHYRLAFMRLELWLLYLQNFINIIVVSIPCYAQRWWNSYLPWEIGPKTMTFLIFNLWYILVTSYVWLVVLCCVFPLQKTKILPTGKSCLKDIWLCNMPNACDDYNYLYITSWQECCYLFLTLWSHFVLMGKRSILASCLV